MPNILWRLNPIAWFISLFGIIIGAALIIDGVRRIFLKGRRKDLSTLEASEHAL